jgi:2'-5' RNA ligase
MKIRSFIAILLAEEMKRIVGDLIAQLKKFNADIKWVNPHNLHLTLKFLGYVEEEQVQPISDRLREIALRYSVFPFGLSGTGVFPDLKRPRVIWTGVQGYEEILKIYKDIESAMEAEGFDRETRALSPHITVGRVRSPRGIDKLTQELVKYKGTDFGRQTAEGIHLMESVLKSGGAEYRSLYEAPLRRK